MFVIAMSIYFSRMFLEKKKKQNRIRLLKCLSPIYAKRTMNLEIMAYEYAFKKCLVLS